MNLRLNDLSLWGLISFVIAQLKKGSDFEVNLNYSPK